LFASGQPRCRGRCAGRAASRREANASASLRQHVVSLEGLARRCSCAVACLAAPVRCRLRPCDRRLPASNRQPRLKSGTPTSSPQHRGLTELPARCTKGSGEIQDHRGDWVTTFRQQPSRSAVSGVAWLSAWKATGGPAGRQWLPLRASRKEPPPTEGRAREGDFLIRRIRPSSLCAGNQCPREARKGRSNRPGSDSKPPQSKTTSLRGDT